MSSCDSNLASCKKVYCSYCEKKGFKIQGGCQEMAVMVGLGKDLLSGGFQELFFKMGLAIKCM